ncbi:MAG: hypothetical protein CMJ75_21215 [Planctomycetaceae bacterium]|nr:hypothetical protein [Planctomycetaceae bacterium]
MANFLLAGSFALWLAGCGDVSPRSEKTPNREPQSKQRSTAAAAKPTSKPHVPPRRARRRVAAKPAPQPTRRKRVATLGSSADRSNRIDQERVRALGIRRLEGAYLTLYTDLPPREQVDVLPAVFDQAVPQWCRYFQRDSAELVGWRLTGYLMQAPQKFRDAGLLPADIGVFLHGYNRGREIWIHEQQTDYYRRHLLLHEGTHGFMQTQLGGAGPPWYMEGVAELLATHTWSDQRLGLRQIPAQAQAAPGWGRIRIIRDQLAAGRDVSLQQILHYGPRAHREIEPYAWSWAVSAFLDFHPRWQSAFRGLQHRVRDSPPDFSERFMKQLGADWFELVQEWRLFVEELHYGYDVPRSAFVRRDPHEVPPEGALTQVATDRGWQSTGWHMVAGRTYALTAEGRYQLDDQPRVWWCEPDGVTIRYHRGRPLGVLLAAMVAVPTGDDEFAAPLLQPIPVGRAGMLTAAKDSLLYLAINEPSSQLSNNKGTIAVRIQSRERNRSSE